ncbi:MAG: sugar phosphate isomerase/epimerase [Ruminococcaceae bacterium]|nr:sugar phosphate isomerase/epimerase [Oscillospiraceae bacterium]
MKKGINIWSFPEMPLADVFALAKKAGFEGVEVALGMEGEISLTSTEEDLLKVKKAAADCGIELYSLSCGLYWDFWLNDDDAAVREKAKSIVKKQLECAKILGCDTILVIPGSVNADFAAPGKVVDYAVTYERALAAINELKPYAEELGVAIALENVWNKFLTSPMEMRDFIDKIDSPFVGSYFDVGNVVFNGYPEQWIRILGNRIKKVHFKDFRRAVGTLDGFVDLLAGDVNYPEVVKALEEVGYDGWVSAEMIPNYKYHTETIIYNTSNAMDAILGR